MKTRGRRATGSAFRRSPGASVCPSPLAAAFGLPFALAGSGAVWSTAARANAAPAWVGPLLTVASCVAWLAVAWRSALALADADARKRADQLDVSALPFLALPLLTATVLTPRLIAPAFPGPAHIVVDLLVLCTRLVGIVATWRWCRSSRGLNDLHPGYLLPTAVSAFVGAYATASMGQRGVATALMVLGFIEGLVFALALTRRHALASPLPPRLRPSLATESSPASWALSAHLMLTGGAWNGPATMIAALACVTAVLQIRRVPSYLRLSYSAATWGFVFSWSSPAAAIIGSLSVVSTSVADVAIVSTVVVFSALGLAVMVASVVARHRTASFGRSDAYGEASDLTLEPA